MSLKLCFSSVRGIEQLRSKEDWLNKKSWITASILRYVLLKEGMREPKKDDAWVDGKEDNELLKEEDDDVICKILNKAK